MSRKSLRPQLNQIRAWAQQGRTDAWIAHQLEVTVQQIQAFRRENDLDGEGGVPAAVEEVDLRAEDDAAIAAELDAAEAERKAEEERMAQELAQREAERAARRAAGDEDAADEDEDGAERPPRRRPRARRSSRSRRGATALEGTFDHGEEGYGLWLDPAVQDDPVYAEHWAGHRPVEVSIEEDRIVIRRAGGDEGEES
jgi:hypothetical protein